MITGLNHLTLSVADLDRALVFYTDVLGLKPVARWYGGAYLAAGDLWFCLALEVNLSDRPLNLTYEHIAFSVSEADFQPLRSRLTDTGAPRWQENHSEGGSLYFLDPDGHKLEIHTTGLKSRIEALKKSPSKDLVLFAPAN
jgi:glutathione S-transferase fosA5